VRKYIYTVVIGALIPVMAIGGTLERRLIGQEDIYWGTGTFTDSRGTTFNKLPRYWDNNAFTDNLTLYGNDLILKGPWVDVRGDIPASLHAAIAAGTDTTNLTAYIDNAIARLSSKGELYFPTGTYHVTQLAFTSKDGITIRTDGIGKTVFVYDGASDNTQAVFKLTGTSYATFVGGMTITSAAGKVPGYGIWITGNGTVQQLNYIEGVRVTNMGVAGIGIGDTTTTNVDMNEISRPSIDNCGTGIRIRGANTNLTSIKGGAITMNATAGVDIGGNTRGVSLERISMYGNGTSSGAHILVRKENSGHIGIRDFLTELGSGGDAPLLKVEPSSGGTWNRSTILAENITATCNFADNSARLIDHQGDGLTILRNIRMAGVAGGTAAVYVWPQNGSPSGANTLITENVQLYDDAVFSVGTSLNSNPVTWYDFASSWGGTGFGSTTGWKVKGKGVNHGFLSDLLTYTAPPTGVTISAEGAMNRVTYKATVAKEAWTNNATSQIIYPFTLPAKTRIVSCYADTTEAYSGLAGTIQLSIGTTGNDNEVILLHDVKTAAVTKGLLDADLGTEMSRAGQIQGGYIRSWTGAVQPRVRLVSGTGNIGTGSATNLTNGSTTIYMTVEVMP